MSTAAGRMFEDPEPLRLLQPDALGVWNNNQAGQFMLCEESRGVLRPEPIFHAMHPRKLRGKLLIMRDDH